MPQQSKVKIHMVHRTPNTCLFKFRLDQKQSPVLFTACVLTSQLLAETSSWLPILSILTKSGKILENLQRLETLLS